MDRRHFLIGSAGIPLAAASSGPALPPLPSLPPIGPPDERFWRELRWHFSIPQGAAYCNTSTLGASPKCVVNAVADHMRYVEEQLVTCDYRPDHPIYLAGYEDEPQLRTRLANLIHAEKEEIALTRNATVGMNYIAHGLDLKAGDEVVLTNQEHPGGRTGYDLRHERDRIEIKEVAIPTPADDPEEIVARYAKEINARTKVVSIPHITSGLGIVMPVKQIAAVARKHGAFVVVDGAQSLGQIAVDVADLGCDAYYSSPHKWLLAPKGCGLLYVRRGAWDRVWTTIASSEWSLKTDAGRRFSQIGTGNQSLHKGLEAALDFLDHIGFANVHARIQQLGDALRAGLREIKGTKIVSPTATGMCAGMTTWTIPGLDDKKVAEELWLKDRVMPRAIGTGIRTSLHVYVTIDDVDRILRRAKALTNHG